MGEFYKLYCLDGTDHIVRALSIEAESDADALEQARALNLTCDSEVWLGAKKIARLTSAGGRLSSPAAGQQPSPPARSTGRQSPPQPQE